MLELQLNTLSSIDLRGIVYPFPSYSHPPISFGSSLDLHNPQFPIPLKFQLGRWIQFLHSFSQGSDIAFQNCSLLNSIPKLPCCLVVHSEYFVHCDRLHTNLLKVFNGFFAFQAAFDVIGIFLFHCRPS